MAGITDRNKSTKVKIRNNKMKNLIIYVIVIGLFFMGLIGVISYVSKYKKEITVTSFNEDMVDRKLIEEVLLSPMNISEKDFTEDMVLWADREEFIGKYTAHFVRANTPIYNDMFAEAPTVRTAYLYNLAADEELLTFPYNINSAGGKIVTVGDRLRIRGSYKDEVSGDKDKNFIVSSTIFDVVEVVDMLNSNNESIVDIIEDANKLPVADREALMASEEFLNNITPNAILMVVKTKDLDKYVEFSAQEAPNFIITLLTRNEELKNTELNTGNSLLQLLQSVKQNANSGNGTDSSTDTSVE